MEIQISGQKKHQIMGWVAISVSTFVTSLWAFWGIVENFHEGWYYESLWMNLGLMFAQYLSPMIIFVAITLISLHWPRLGAGLHGIIALFAIWFFDAFSNAATFLIIIPLIGLGAMYWFGRPQPKKWAASILIGLPLLTLIISGISPMIRISQRFDDGIRESRVVQGNSVKLTWAPEGPGWPKDGTDWYQAHQTCDNLAADGFDLLADPQNIWRLPTVEEAVRSLALHGQNSGGEWDSETAVATYQSKPDKESPLWNIHSQVIYWWTTTEIDPERAYMIAYDGKVWPRSKDFGPAYLGFRCVKNP